MLLADTAQTPQEIEETEQRLSKVTERDRISFHLAFASLFARKGNLVSADDEIQRALELDRKSPRAHLALADLFLQQSNPNGALEELKTAANLSPVRSATHLKYAEFKAKIGAADDAKATLKEITRQAPDYLPAWGCLAKFAYAEKKYDESLSFLENIFNRDALNLEGRLLQSEVWLARGDLKLAFSAGGSKIRPYRICPPRGQFGRAAFPRRPLFR
jgi:Tfp pilus assembly protein PilF